MLTFGGSLILAGAIGASVAGTAVPGFRIGLFATLGGIGNLPCWISVARCLTDGGKAGVAALIGIGPTGAACPGTAGAPGAAGGPDAVGVPGAAGPAGGGGAGLLMTVLITVVL